MGRCQWHKRENVVSYLSKSEQSLWRKRPPESTRQLRERLMVAAEELAGQTLAGQTTEACEALGVARSTLYRRRQVRPPEPSSSGVLGRTDPPESTPSTRLSARKSSGPCTDCER